MIVEITDDEALLIYIAGKNFDDTIPPNVSARARLRIEQMQQIPEGTNLNKYSFIKIKKGKNKQPDSIILDEDWSMNIKFHKHYIEVLNIKENGNTHI